jgi:hypothetical protein
MGWMLRVTDTVPMRHREAYQVRMEECFARLPKTAAHRGSFRVSFGRSLEFMHLVEFASLSDYENAPADLWTSVIQGYRENLADDSRWEWMRVVTSGDRRSLGTG